MKRFCCGILFACILAAIGCGSGGENLVNPWIADQFKDDHEGTPSGTSAPQTSPGTPTNTPIPIPTPVPISTPTPTSTPTSNPTPVPTPTTTSIPTPTPISTSTPIPTPIPSGLHYVWWNFGKSTFKSLYADVTIYDEPDNGDGLYFQMYQGKINNIGFYFGLQTKVYNVNTGVTARGLIFSRWETRDLANARLGVGAWSQSAGYEGDFIGIRKHYAWSKGSYEIKFAFTDSDSVGDWYGVWIYNQGNSSADYLGSIRFPSVAQSKAGIADGGGTWTELYSKEVQGTPIPTWHVSVDGFSVTEQKALPQSAVSDYSNVNQTDIYYEGATKKIHFWMGPAVTRQHGAGKLY